MASRRAAARPGEIWGESTEEFRIDCDSGDDVRDIGLEQAWSWLRGWRLEALIRTLPCFVEMGLEDAAEMALAGACPKGPSA